MSFFARMAARAVRQQIDAYNANNPLPANYPQADLQKLESIAEKISNALPDLAAQLKETLPKALPPENLLTDDVRNAAITASQQLMAMVPGRFREQLDEARKENEVDYNQARQQYGMMRKVLPAIPFLTEDIKTGLVNFAAAEDITPEELADFDKTLAKLHGLLLLREDDLIGQDFDSRIQVLAEIGGLIAIATGDDNKD